MTNTDELKRLAEAARDSKYGDRRITEVSDESIAYIAAANPSAILSLIEEVEGLREMFGKLQVENVTLREELDKALEVIGPFAKEALSWQKHHGSDPSNTWEITVQPAHEEWENTTKFSMDDLRAASAFTERHKSQGESDE